MSKFLTKLISFVLCLCVFSGSVLASDYTDHSHDVTSYSPYTKLDFSSLQNDELNAKLTTISQADILLNELLATLPKDATKEQIQDLLNPAFPNVIVVGFNEMKSQLTLIAFLNDNQINTEDTKLLSTLHNSSVDGYLICWKDASTGETVLRAMNWCEECIKFVILIVTSFIIFCLEISGFPELREFLIENFTCEEGHIIATTQTLMSVEYAPACGICLQTNYMTWSGSWWCTACNQNK